jgi:hypothetical protein
MRRRDGLACAALAWTLALSPWMAWGCTASRPSQAPAPPTQDPVVAQLTQLLKLDKVQQARTQQLLEEFYERNAKIREKWDHGAKVHPEELLGSRGIFERDFQAILTEDQKRIYAAERLKVQPGAHRFAPGS